MRKKLFFLAGCFVVILFSLIGCLSILATTEKETTAKKAKDAVEKKSSLGDLHEAAKIACEQCHEESPPNEPVSTACCLGCHQGYAKQPSANVAKGTPNPHTAHPGQGFTRCNLCHHVHKPSEDGCKPCHDFGFQVP
jgi:hypothetical protein